MLSCNPVLCKHSLIQGSGNNRFSSLALDSTNLKCDAWSGPKLLLSPPSWKNEKSLETRLETECSRLYSFIWHHLSNACRKYKTRVFMLHISWTFQAFKTDVFHHAVLSLTKSTSCYLHEWLHTYTCLFSGLIHMYAKDWSCGESEG